MLLRWSSFAYNSAMFLIPHSIYIPNPYYVAHPFQNTDALYRVTKAAEYTPHCPYYPLFSPAAIILHPPPPRIADHTVLPRPPSPTSQVTDVTSLWATCHMVTEASPQRFPRIHLHILIYTAYNKEPKCTAYSVCVTVYLYRYV